MRNIPTVTCTAAALLCILTSVQLRAAEPSTQPAQDASSLEEKFAATLNNSVMVGHFTIDGDDKPPKTERYTIVSVTKIHGDMWMFKARIQFGNKDVTVPLIIPVRWAGDTPVISVTHFGIPGIGNYSARVVIYENRYAGTWSGSPTHGGTLFGRIEHPATQPAPKE